ncbi:hypothetical protein [Pseudomonas sp. SG20052]|uniref:hypothetical protein n=1 Tax=Pseudomonas sp. SG20052 TaxID=3074147 RepID=UPI00287FAC06|nr:hypothetical protein [Pseudomonas sp. SG20052]WNF58473.1 hypothetical protein RHP74_14650 [Pseudomonas sp. SG20052]WNF58487.1 hypothetical protein RHP74_14720 [Pseudomonas sp. SG20052]
MKFLYVLPLLFLALFSSSAFAGWKCNTTTTAGFPSQCSRASVKDSPETLITAFVDAVVALNTNVNRKDYKAGVCTMNGSENAICGYSYTSFGTVTNNSIGAIKEAVVCPGTIEVRGPDSPLIKSSTDGKYYVSWRTESVESDICHNSCSYLASSAQSTGSSCYRSSGSTSSGFCNFFVGLNSPSPSCSAEAGYTAPAVGDPLNPSTDPGDGGDDGTDPDPGDGGNPGDGGDGGDGDSGFDGELSFSNPGSLKADSVLDSEVNAVHYQAFVHGMQVDLNHSGFGVAMEEFQQKISASNSGGTCPTADIAILGTIITFDAHCVLFAEISPILSAVFLAAWCLVALRVFLSA